MSKKANYKAQLQRLYTWSAVGYIGLAILAGVVMANVTYPLSIGHLAKDVLASERGAVLVPGDHSIMDLSLKLMVVGLLVLSAVVPALYVTRQKKEHEKAIKKRVLVWRWADLAVGSSIMVGIVSILSGFHSIQTVKLLGSFMIVTCVLGWLIERAMTDGKKLVRPLFVLSILTGALPWVVVASSAVATPFYAAVRAPWYVYAVYGELLVGFTMIALNQWRYIAKQKQWKDYLFVERNYALTTVATRVIFVAILLVGLHK